MGTLTLPPSGVVYLDASILIYSVEKHPVYFPLLLEMWQSVASGKLQAATSDLSILETRVLPLRAGNADLIRAYDLLLAQPTLQRVPLSAEILKTAAELRNAALFAHPMRSTSPAP